MKLIQMVTPDGGKSTIRIERGGDGIVLTFRRKGNEATIRLPRSIAEQLRDAIRAELPMVPDP